MKIDKIKFDAIMLNAARAYQRENWIIEAADLSEATGEPVANIVQGFFMPYSDRLIEATENKNKSEDELHDYFFHKFSEIVL